MESEEKNLAKAQSDSEDESTSSSDDSDSESSKIEPIIAASAPPTQEEIAERRNSEEKEQTEARQNEDARELLTMDLVGNAVHRFRNNFVRTAKYTIITFFPKSLLEQFMRVANVYFLIISGLQQIPNISPTGRWTTLGPLAVVLAITLIKEAIEDFKRHRQDKEVNNRSVKVLRDGSNELQKITWQEVMVGDIVKVKNRTYIPADLVLISSNESSGACYIETANLDGETNLKVRQALPETSQMQSVDALKNLKGTVVRCEQPNNRLYTFDGSINLNGRVYPLDPKQVLLRGAMLRNTDWIYGIAIYTGKDTKVVKNLSPPPRKRTNVERLLNYQIIVMFLLLVILSAVSTIGYAVWQSNYGAGSWYLQFKSSVGADSASSIITFIILYNNLIPISLYVCIEMVKFGQAFFINNDVKMYHAESDTPALARTSNLNEELGQVQYIFSDKTGTLTCNKMEFKRCTFAGNSYGESEPEKELEVDTQELDVPMDNVQKKLIEWYDERMFNDLKNDSEESQVLREAMLLLSVCHTVIPEIEKNTENIIYQASSPDEAALVKAAAFFGYVFTKRTPKTVSIKKGDEELEFKILNVLEFTNVRKRMSVIVRTPEGKIVLYTKGADTVIYERLRSSDQPYRDVTRHHLDNFAKEGLRTLCLAKAELDEKNYEKWNKIFEAAATKIGGREEALEAAAEMIEKDLLLLGATAVEDKLQDGVPEAIATLAQAGIKIWVLTGDKQETAINIGYSCKLLTENMKQLILNKDTKAETEKKLNELLEEYKDRTIEDVEGSDEEGPLAMIIDGGTLQHALEDDLKKKLLELGTKCKAVICCRVSPLQKAQVVQLVRQGLKSITLAIGDGANDVSMIQAAHLGIGISGEEGLQAARASDYAIAQFRFLVRLLLVHGRWSYRRTSKVILYSFYKNVLLQFTQFYFVFLNGYSGQILFEQWTLAVYNVIFTLVPILLFGLQDQDLGAEKILQFPQLYKSGQKGQHFNFRIFWKWMANAIFSAFIIFAICELATMHDVWSPNGKSMDLYSTGTLIYTCIILTVSLKLGIEAKRWTIFIHIGVWGFIFVWILWMLIFGVFATKLNFGTAFFYVPYNTIPNATYFFSWILVVVVMFLRESAWKYFKRTYLPRPYHLVQEVEAKERQQKGASLNFSP
eukprot:TRINITY_DN3531_c0_g1_i3.p1 TRINITY_DN3531_c0_g1~~TRINITY_DN3531_c0_g1_i3.p1  ORF type:complete len:1154 (-),score=411.04 TRINITY_DN3531_c0_g1_i3:48-3509(-)